MKKVIFLLMFALMLMTTQAFAHSKMESSSPQNGETVTKPVQEIALTFSANIERVSKLEIKNEQGQSFPTSNIESSKNKLKAALEKPLPNGKYTVDWMNIGEDGHSLRGSFSFQVNAPQEAQQPPTKQEQPTQNAQPEQNKTDNIPSTNENESTNSSLVIGLVVVAALIIGIVVALLRKKRA